METEETTSAATPDNSGQGLDFAQKFDNLSRRENQIRQEEKRYKNMGSDIDAFSRIKSGSWRESEDDRNALLQTLGVSDYNELGQFFNGGNSQGEQGQQPKQVDPTLQRLSERLDAQDHRDQQEEDRNRRSQLRQSIDSFEGEDYAGLKGLDDGLGSEDFIQNYISSYKEQTGQDIDPMQAAKAVQDQYQSTFTKLLQNPHYAKIASEHLGKRQEANRDQGNNSQNTISNNMNARPPAQNPNAWLDDDDASKSRMADNLSWT